ncbi:MAG: hypothetical protein PHW25_17415 [Zoogloea sp.]|uniref:hypothetical protein n=1 Tax=Zoogloea sp. TaxID=49181 RepID=UPI00262216E2|nr:hypothetical protein [Zoogloea sp.]MDD3328863.1 hypothetical protein [Zoogloea sp.]
MTATTTPRNTPERQGDVIGAPAKGSALLLAGTIAVANAGYAAPATTATGLVALGRVEETVDNTAGADGAAVVKVRRGIFKFANQAGDLVTQANAFTDCYLVDNQTVAATSAGNTRSRAGKVIAVEPDGVFVAIGLGY